MKWSAGPIVAQARVQRYLELDDCTPETLRQQTFGYRLHDLDGYWDSLRAKRRFFAVVVYLEHERWLDEIITPQARSRGESWIVLVTPELEAAWLGARPLPTLSSDAVPTKPKRYPRTITPSVRFEVFRRDSFTCQY